MGFETTTPSDVIAVKNAVRDGLDNFSLLTANKTMPGAYEAMASSTDAYLYPGHVHAIIGTKLCRDLAERGVSGTIAGFTGDELLAALAVTVKNVSEGKPFFVNAYPRVVTDEGSPAAVALVDKFMKPCDAEWRGIGVIPDFSERHAIRITLSEHAWYLTKAHALHSICTEDSHERSNNIGSRKRRKKDIRAYR